MKALGRHIIIELSTCDAETLGDLEKVKEIMINAAHKAKAQILKVAFHKFSPQGVSGVVVIAESHLSIHTWPEYRYAAVDIYTCGETADPWQACSYAAKEFKAGDIATTVIERGIEAPFGKFKHEVNSPALVP